MSNSRATLVAVIVAVSIGAVLLTAVLFDAPPPAEGLVLGRWQGTGPDGEDVVLEFLEGGTVITTVHGTGGVARQPVAGEPGKAKGEYKTRTEGKYWFSEGGLVIETSSNFFVTRTEQSVRVRRNELRLGAIGGKETVYRRVE